MERVNGGGDVRHLDVAILGGGLAGLLLARQLRRALPHATIEVFERAEERGWKVGESTVEIASSYLTRRLGLAGSLFDQQLPKNGLRFFFDDPTKQTPFLEMSEIGTNHLPEMPAFQLDRARLERDLITMNRQDGVPVHLGVAVRELVLGKDGAEHTFVATRDGHGEKISARWALDASGRASLIARALDLRVEEDHPVGAVWARYEKVVDMDDLPPSFPDRAADADGTKYAAWRARVRHTARFLSTNHFCYRGYWIWLIPLARGVTSVGWVGTREGVWHDALRKEDGFRAFCDSHRAVRDLMAGSKPLDVGSYKQLAYGTKRFLGKDRWACVGEAGAFSDPFYSPGSDYIALENDMTTDLVVRELRGEPKPELDARVDAYDAFLQFRFRATMLLYKDLYVTLGSFDALLMKWNFDIACYYNLWVDSYFKDEHLDLREVKSQLRRKDGVLEALGAYSRMFQEVVRELDRRGQYHARNKGLYNFSGDAIPFRHEVGQPRTRKRVLETTAQIFDYVRKQAESLCGESVSREVQAALEPFQDTVTQA